MQPTNNRPKPLLYQHYQVNDLKLGQWVNRQQVQYKKGTLKADHIAVLENLGFQWSLKVESLIACYNTLFVFHDENGHSNDFDPSLTLREIPASPEDDTKVRLLEFHFSTDSSVVDEL